MTTYATANDDMLGMLKTAWDTTSNIMLYDNVPGTIPTTTAPWARAALRHSNGFQSSLSGALGNQSFTRQGLLIVQIFVPMGESLSEAYSLARIVTGAFEGKSSTNGVWFRNARINEIGPDGNWFQVNVVVDFEYHEVR